MNIKTLFFLIFLFGMQFTFGQGLFNGWDVTGTNPNCYTCYAIQEFTENAIAGLDCGKIQSTAEVTVGFDCKTLSVEADGIILTEDLRASAGCECLFRALSSTGVGSLNPSISTEVINIDIYDDIVISGEELASQTLYTWYDSEGNLIYQGKDLFITDVIAEKYTLKVIDINGFETFKEYDLKYKPNRLEKLFPNPITSGNLNITYKINEAQSAYIMIFSYYMTDGISYNYIIDKDATERNIDVSSYPLGLYKVALVTDGQIVDVKILSRQ